MVLLCDINEYSNIDILNELLEKSEIISAVTEIIEYERLIDMSITS